MHAAGKVSHLAAVSLSVLLLHAAVPTLVTAQGGSDVTGSASFTEISCSCCLVTQAAACCTECLTKSQDLILDRLSHFSIVVGGEDERWLTNDKKTFKEDILNTAPDCLCCARTLLLSQHSYAAQLTSLCCSNCQRRERYGFTGMDTTEEFSDSFITKPPIYLSVPSLSEPPKSTTAENKNTAAASPSSHGDQVQKRTSLECMCCSNAGIRECCSRCRIRF